MRYCRSCKQCKLKTPRFMVSDLSKEGLILRYEYWICPACGETLAYRDLITDKMVHRVPLYRKTEDPVVKRYLKQRILEG